MIWLLVLSIAYDHSDKVWRCRDEIVDTGQRTHNGHIVYRLKRTDCKWVDFDDMYNPIRRDRDYWYEIYGKDNDVI